MAKKTILQDDKIYTFEPGRNGGMTAHPKEPNTFNYTPHPEQIYTPSAPKAKSIGPKRMTQVGSARG